MKARNGNSNRLLIFLVDTGADISLLKQFNNDYYRLNTSHITTISGIGQGTIKSLGSIQLDLRVNNFIIPHEFHIVHGDFPIPCDGILGMDFMKRYNCMLDFSGDNDCFILRPQNFHSDIHMPIAYSGIHDNILLPARSEVIRRVQIISNEEEVLVINQEPQPGVMIASTMVNSKHAYIRILNTTSENKILDSRKIATESLTNYNIVHANNAQDDRTGKILSRLKKNFPEQFSEPLSKLCSDYSDVFGLETEPITANNFYRQNIRLRDRDPVYIKNYRIPHSQRDEINEQVTKLISDGLVEPSISEYNSPLLLVPKKTLPNSAQKRWRLVVDYRQINKKVVADKFPLPRIEDILDQLGRAKYFSCLDLMSGFHQIELNEKSRDITSFSTDNGSYRFTRLPYGLKIAPNSFQRMMTLAFSGLGPTQAFLYMDDLIVIGCTEKHMLRNLSSVFELCRKHNLKLHPDKCSFFRREVTFLGHRCTDKGILPDDTKYAVIKNYPVPTDADSARRFVAFCNYYRRFVENFSNYSRHITRLCRKKVKFEWTVQCNEAFEYLKKQLMKPTLLQYPDFEKEFCITTDASKHACGAVLSQEYDGKQLPVAFASKSFTKGESNKSTTEQELTAIHWAIQHFRPYIYGTHFLVKTDHRPLSYLFSLKNPSSKLTRMRLDLEEYDFSVEYLKGKQNMVADALSRITINDLKEHNLDTDKINKVTTRSNTRQNIQSHLNNDSLESTNTKLVKKPNIYQVINYNDVRKFVKLKLSTSTCSLKHGKTILGHIKIDDLYVNGTFDLNQFFHRLEIEAGVFKIGQLQMSPSEPIFDFVSLQLFKNMGNDKLRKVEVALLPRVTLINEHNENEIKAILLRYHDDPAEGGHTGVTRTSAKIRRHFYWRGMIRDITKYVKTCRKCQQAKITQHTKTPMTLTPTPLSPFDIVLVDTIGPFPRSEDGNEYAVTLICDLTKYLVALPIPDKSSKTVAKVIFESHILTYGPMRTLLTDMGTEYRNCLVEDLCKYLKVDNITSTAYHHQTLGTVERSHRTFNEYMRSYISMDKDDWDVWLKYFTYCFNTTPSVVHGYCPYELIFGRIPNGFQIFNQIGDVQPLYNVDDYSKEVRYRLEIAYKRARLMLERAKLKRKTWYDEKSRRMNVISGDLVLLRNEAGHKLDNKYLGPFRVISIGNNGNVVIENSKMKAQTVHRDRLKLYSV